MTRVIYDAGALIAAERNDRYVLARHAARLAEGLVPRVPAAVVAQVSRSSRQVVLRRILRGCDVIELGEDGAHLIGSILAAGRTSDVVDGSVVACARRGDVVMTSDPNDIELLASAIGLSLVVVGV